MPSLEDERKELRHKVELFHALEALKTNQSFRKLITLGFMQEEVIRLNRLASREMTAEEKIARSQQAHAAPILEAYLTRVEFEGEDARSKIPELDILIDQEAQEET
jgi:hypothetical protein